MMKLALVLLPILNAASADSTKCWKNTIAVDGVPNKCFWYKYFPHGMTFSDQQAYCFPAGRLFTPESMNEIQSVENSVIPKSYINSPKGNYFVSYVLYNFERFAGPSFGKHGYVSYNPPYIFLNSTSAMWGNGKGLGSSHTIHEPNNAQNCISHDDGCEPIVVAARYPNGKVGLADVKINKVLNSLICEFPSMN